MSQIVESRGWAGRTFAKASRTGDRSQFPIELEQAGIMLKMHLSDRAENLAVQGEDE